MATPNIIFILLDDLGKEWISCYGATDIETPNIDSLAAGGIRFDTGTDRKPQRFIDLKADPQEQTDITGREDASALASRQKLESLIPSWPERDADPICTPAPPQPWDIPATVKSIEWKKGRPE